MYFTDSLSVILRRLPILLLGLAMIAGASVLAFVVVPTRYQASAQVLLLPPSDPIPEGDPVNPYLNIPGSLTLTASLIAGAVTTPDARRELSDAGYRSEYATGVVPQTGPLISVTVTDTDAAAVLKTRDEVLRRIAAELESVQVAEGVPDVQMIVAREYGVSQQAEVLAGNRLRALGMIVALGSVLTLFMIFAVDRRRYRRTSGTRDVTRSMDAIRLEQRKERTIRSIADERIAGAEDRRRSGAGSRGW